MTLPTPPKTYSQGTESQRNLILEAADSQNVKLNVDIDIPFSTRVMLHSSDGKRWQISVSTSGVLTVTAA